MIFSIEQWPGGLGLDTMMIRVEAVKLILEMIDVDKTKSEILMTN